MMRRSESSWDLVFCPQPNGDAMATSTLEDCCFPMILRCALAASVVLAAGCSDAPGDGDNGGRSGGEAGSAGAKGGDTGTGGGGRASGGQAGLGGAIGGAAGSGGGQGGAGEATGGGAGISGGQGGAGGATGGGAGVFSGGQAGAGEATGGGAGVFFGGQGGAAGAIGGDTGNGAGGGAFGGQAGAGGGVGGVAGDGAGAFGGHAEAGGDTGNGGGAGAGASGGQGGAGGATGGTAGTGAMPGSALVSPLSLNFVGQCQVPAQSFTISNTGSIPLTWHAELHGSPPVYVSPPFSTLAPGTNVAVAVTQFSQPFYGTFSGTVAISTDVAGPLGPIAVSYSVLGSTVVPPSDIDFGEVPLGSQKAISFSAAPTQANRLRSSNPDFLLTGMTPADPSPGFWTLIFVPHVSGRQSTTLTLWSFPNPVVCPPNTFNAIGVGVTP